MTLTKVLEMLYGKVASGYLQATYIENGKCRSKCFQIDQLSEMESFIRKYGKSCNTYIDINPRNREMEYYERGSRDDISTVVGAYQDYDIKGIAHKEENLPLSAEELYAFLKELPVQPTFLVYTGNGVHAYWLFEKPYEIRSASERNYIEQILKGWETHVHQLAKERYGWNFDAVADLPRMLRAPETTNFKTEERPVCKVVSICENYYLPTDLEPYCDVKPSSANPVPDADEFALMGTGSGEELVSKCTFIQHCRDNASNISEPFWYAMLSNVALTADGHEMAHSLSSPYPGYTYQETEKKYRHALEQDKPTTCEFIKNRLCFHCGRSCGVRAPIALVHSKASVPPNWEEPIPFDNFSVPDFPVETLPEAIGTYVSAVAESTQTPVDLAATSAIAIMSICLQGKYKIQPKGDWQENLNTFCLAFMEPSERMSRLGRDYLQVGMYTEIKFPNADVRFIAINNGVDSENGQDSDFTPFLNIINEWYAKDTSKKIRAVFKAKGEAGKPLCTNPPYGYIKDPEDKNHWIVDPEAAEIVKEAFRLCVQGYGVAQIASIFTKRKLLNPTAYAKSKGRNVPDNRDTVHEDYHWGNSTISHMLTRQEYLGHLVNFKTYRKSYKNKKIQKNDPENWQIFENCHEAIIDQETFDIVQRIRDGRRRLTPMGEMPMLSGMLFCADCGAKLYQVRHRGLEHDKEHFVCATYRKVKGGCSSHQIRNVVVEEILLSELQRITAFAREHEDEFLEMVTKKSLAELNKNQREGKRELEQAMQRISKLDKIIQRLYEDNVEGKISDERFAKMSANYEAEQEQLEARINELKDLLSAEKEESLNASHFLDLVRRYTDIRELDAEIIREFVEKIYVYKAERVDGHRVQRIKIIWNCIGEFNTPANEKSA